MLLSDETGTDDEPARADPGVRRATDAAADSRSSTVLRVRSDVIDRFMTQIGEIRIAAAELAELTVLHLDKDFEVIAAVTGQAVERLSA